MKLADGIQGRRRPTRPATRSSNDWLGDEETRHDFSAFPVDVADFESCQKRSRNHRGEVGPIDVLVNNAGITRDMTFKKMDKTDWDAVMRPTWTASST